MSGRRESLMFARLEGAVHIPMAQISARTDDLPADQLLVVLCHHGVRSQMVVDFLRSAGFDNAVNLDGGIDAWACDVTHQCRAIDSVPPKGDWDGCR